MKNIFYFIFAFFRFIWKFLTTGAAVLSTLILLAFIALIAASFFQRRPPTVIPDNSALVFAPRGSIVEKKSPLDPVSRMLSSMSGTPLHEELLIGDVVEGIRAAGTDERIKVLVVAPSHLEKASLDQLRDIGHAIEEFKDNGKIVIATGDNFSQGQYYLASWADEIYLNPMGMVNLHGFGVFRLYIAELLNKLSVNFHIFKVGTFKSALEPFIRNDMSPAAKEANQLWLTSLWDSFCSDLAANRGIPQRAITQAVNKLADNMHIAKGDSAQMALNNGLVDGLKTRQELRDYLGTLVGKSTQKGSFRQINFSRYLDTIATTSKQRDNGRDRVGIIVAQGNIIYGEAKVGQIGSDALGRRIRLARNDDNIKALVLRVDSGGGSAFASELIRQELLLTQKAGKPVVISMGSMAASGAYWISADADKIFAAPTTLTGSIGIFGAMPTFEKSLAKIGVFSDGTGTTELAGAGNPTRPFPESLGRAIQSGVERGYRRFISIVATGRKIEKKQVEKIAEGRVWDGATALKLGLVDELGSLEDAVNAAADLAGIPTANAMYIFDAETPAELLLKSLGLAEAALGLPKQPVLSIADKILQDVLVQYDFITHGDPQNMYSHCMLPGSISSF
ncbi:MAG: signal peptide peptidase SppA [Desulfobulbus sp.]|nr:MAG: signal peptide peptidase SppA [Desulfobulbus sp.]